MSENAASLRSAAFLNSRCDNNVFICCVNCRCVVPQPELVAPYLSRFLLRKGDSCASILTVAGINILSRIEICSRVIGDKVDYNSAGCNITCELFNAESVCSCAEGVRHNSYCNASCDSTVKLYCTCALFINCKCIMLIFGG